MGRINLECTYGLSLSLDDVSIEGQNSGKLGNYSYMSPGFFPVVEVVSYPLLPVLP